MSKLDLRTLPEPGNKYKIGLKIGGGVGGEVYEALENQTGKRVAIKVIDLGRETQEEVQREYQVLKQFSGECNFPEFYGIYAKKGRDDSQKVWLVMEFCEGGDATSLVRKLQQENKKLRESHIAYIMREAIKAVTVLHENETGHRDIRGSNILLTADGRVKLVDYGISKRTDDNHGMKTCIGSPGWLAPEVIKCRTETAASYDQKADVWALGITAIELGDGQTPFEGMHPGRALFQIVNNPPPSLRKPSEWSLLYQDFVNECLVKEPENRPCVQELLLHPFFEAPDKEEHLVRELGALLEKLGHANLYKVPEVQVRKGFVKTELRSQVEEMLEEDLAAMAKASEDSVLFQLYERFKKNQIHTFVGDILLILNSNKTLDKYGAKYCRKYRFKAKSQNAPHIYSIADSAYRDVFHHNKPQHIIFSGETGAGKTVNMMHATDQLLFLGQGLFKSSEQVTKALAVIHIMGNAATPHNPDSTRHVLQMQLTFTDTGKTSGAIFRVYLLEKERITMTAKKQANFHLFYCFYNALQGEGHLADFHLDRENYKFLKAEMTGRSPRQDAARFRSFENNLGDLGFEEEHVSAVRKTLAAVLLIGEIEFLEDEDGIGTLETPDVAQKVAALLGVDHKKLIWSLLNYCLIVKGEAVMRRNSRREAEEARSALARGLYSRLADWVVNRINHKISLSRIVYGDKHVISLLDFYGFECYKRNTLNTLFVNMINEQLQFHYNQQIFAWAKIYVSPVLGHLSDYIFVSNAQNELMTRFIEQLLPEGPPCVEFETNDRTPQPTSSEHYSYDDPLIIATMPQQSAEEEEIPFPNLQYDDNKILIDLIMSKPEGLLHKIDEATRSETPCDFIDNLPLTKKGVPILPETSREFSINHYTGKLTYEASDIPEKNRDFLPPEIIDAMRLSTQDVTKEMFSSLLSKSGNLSTTQSKKPDSVGQMLAPPDAERVDTTPSGQYSQSRQMRTAATTFRAACADLFKGLTVRGSGFHFVKCIRTDLSGEPGAFDPEAVRQQLRALSVVNTVLMMQRGYSHGVPQEEFIRRYKFLAFDFDENVEETKDNCRLLLLRLKLEGWAMGKTKVFLKYFNMEYLSRLYETQLKKIVKVQSMMRAFVARRKLCAKIRKYQIDADEKKNAARRGEPEAEDKAARIIQKRFREHVGRKRDLTEEEKSFLRPWCKRWRTKSIFQVLLLYRAERLQVLANFCLQGSHIHLYNQNSLTSIGRIRDGIDIDELNAEPKTAEYLPPLRPFIPKLPFAWADLNPRGNAADCQPLPKCDIELLKSEIQVRLSEVSARELKKEKRKNFQDKEIQTSFTKEEEILLPIPYLTVTTEGITKQRDYGKDSLEQQNEISTSPLTEETKRSLAKASILPSRRDEIVGNPIIRRGERCMLASSIESAEESEESDSKGNLDRKFSTSISEMEEKFRNKDYEANGDDPPFNFRALLKKTNATARSLKSSNEQFDFPAEIRNFRFSKSNVTLPRGEFGKQNRQPCEMVVRTEIAPGIIVCGRVSDL